MSQSLPSTQIAEDTQLANALTELQVGIRKISMYGLSHSIVPKIAKQLSEKLNTILEVAAPLAIVIAKNELLYQQASIAPGNAVIQELSQTLHRLNIIQITFQEQLTEDAVLKFLSFVLENRTKTFTQNHALVLKFHEDVPTISLQLVTFKDAITQQGEVRENTGSGNVWQNLLNHAGDSKLPEDVRRLIESDPNHPPNTDAVANAINALYAETGLQKEAYETTVLAFLKHQIPEPENEAGLAAPKTGDHQNLGEIFSKLRADVREQVFKLSMQTQDDQVMPLENFLTHMPPSLLPEVLKHMDLSEDSLSPPAYRLLKKVASFTKENEEMKNQLAEKLKNHAVLRKELIPKKTNDPATSPMQKISKKIAYTEENAFSEAEVNHQLALTLLEILQYPSLPEQQSERSLKMLRELLIQGIGDDTLETLMQTIQALLKNFGTAQPRSKAFWRTQLKLILSPEIVVQILKIKKGLNGTTDRVMASLVSIAGDDLFRVAFHVLEVEKHLSTRKQALRFLIGCGTDVIPHAVSQLKNPRWFVVRNMLVILKGVHAIDEVLEIIPCIKHKAEQVRLAALQALGAIAPETDLLLDALNISLHDQDESISKIAIIMLVASRHTKATTFVSNLFLEAEDNGKWHGHQLLLLKEMEKHASPVWLPTLLKFKKGFFFMLMHWGQQRQIQSAMRKAISEIGKKGSTDARR